MTITDDIKRLGDICYMVGAIEGAVELKVEAEWVNDFASEIVDYITELYNYARGCESERG